MRAVNRAQLPTLLPYPCRPTANGRQSFAAPFATAVPSGSSCNFRQPRMREEASAGSAPPRPQATVGRHSEHVRIVGGDHRPGGALPTHTGVVRSPYTTPRPNDHGQLGLGNTEGRWEPTLVGPQWRHLAAGRGPTCKWQCPSRRCEQVQDIGTAGGLDDVSCRAERPTCRQS
jgi:hypothetical protein